MVDRLGVRGFVTALADPNDRRRRAVALTERGREVTQAAQAVAAEITAATLAPLTERGREVTQAAQAVAAEITAATLAPLTEDERRAVSLLLKKLT